MTGDLCPRCGQQLSRDGVCLGDSPDAPHDPAVVVFPVYDDDNT